MDTNIVDVEWFCKYNQGIEISMKLTVDEYVEARGTKCPHCGSDNILNAQPTITTNDSSEVTCRNHCDECGNDWFDIFRLDGYRVR